MVQSCDACACDCWTCSRPRLLNISLLAKTVILDLRKLKYVRAYYGSRRVEFGFKAGGI